jgi:hypothetical protein
MTFTSLSTKTPKFQKICIVGKNALYLKYTKIMEERMFSETTMARLGDNPEELVDKGVDLIEQAREVLKPAFISMPEAEFQRSFKVAQARHAYVEKGVPIMLKHADFLARKIQPAVLKTAYSLWKALNIAANRLEILLKETHKSQAAIGSWLYGVTADYEKAAAKEGLRGDATAATLAKRLEANRPTNGKRAKKKTES